mgnify:CR=1 FL=1
MKIIRNACPEVQFEDLRLGDVFIATDDNCVYMRTDEAYEYSNDLDHYYNAVSLGDGSLVKIKDWEKLDAVPIQAGAGITKTMAPRTDETIKEFPLEKIEVKWADYYNNIYDYTKTTKD